MKKISTTFKRDDNCYAGDSTYRNFIIAVKNTDEDTAEKIVDAITDQISTLIDDEWDTGSAWCVGCPSYEGEYRDMISIELDECESVSKQIEDIKRFYKIAKKNVLAQYN